MSPELMVRTSERSPSGQQLIEHHAQAENVGTPIDPMPLSASLLRAHVRGSSCKPCCSAEILLLERQSEVGHERLTRSLNEDVTWLDIPMDQPSCVSVMQGFSDRRHQFR